MKENSMKEELSEYDFLILFCSKLVSRRINSFNVSRLEKKLYEYALDSSYAPLFKKVAINNETERISLIEPITVFCTVGTLVAINYPEKIVIPFSKDEAARTLDRYSDEHKEKVDTIINGIFGKTRKHYNVKYYDFSKYTPN